jgi:hypothetical protein
MSDHLQILRLSQFRCQSAASPLDIVRKLEINITIPLIVKTTSTQNYTTARYAGEDIGGISVDSSGGAEICSLQRRSRTHHLTTLLVHFRYGHFGVFSQHHLALLPVNDRFTIWGREGDKLDSGTEACLQRLSVCTNQDRYN